MVFVIVHTPWPTSKGLDHSYLHVYVCLLLCFMSVLAFLVLGFATFDTFSGFVVVWLHSTSMRPCLGVTTWDASLDAGLLHACPSLFRSVRRYVYHVCLCHPLAFFASLHPCLHAHALVLLAGVSSMLQHNEVMDIRSKPTFVPHGHHLLFTFPLVCFLSCFFTYHVYHAYLLYASFICSLHLVLPLLVYCFFVFAFACTHKEQGYLKLGHSLPGTSKKGADTSM